MRRILLALPLLLVALLLTACPPIAGGIADFIENSDGATLTYVHQGLAFDPGPELARGVIIRAEGDELALLSVPGGATCTLTNDRLDCRLGQVTEATTVGLTGLGVVANATWRRVGDSSVYMVFAQPSVEPQGGQ